MLNPFLEKQINKLSRNLTNATLVGNIKFRKPKIPQELLNLHPTDVLSCYDYVPENLLSWSSKSGLGVPLIVANNDVKKRLEDRRMSLVPATMFLRFEKFWS